MQTIAQNTMQRMSCHTHKELLISVIIDPLQKSRYIALSPVVRILERSGYNTSRDPNTRDYDMLWTYYNFFTEMEKDLGPVEPWLPKSKVKSKDICVVHHVPIALHKNKA